MSSETNIKNTVLEKIRHGEVTMHSRTYFVFEIASLVIVAFVALIVTVFILNFIIFSVRLNGQDQLLAHGPSGWGAFVQFFPWGWLILDVGLIVVLEWMLRTFRWGWRIPALYFFGGLLALALGFGFLLEATPLNDSLFEHRHDLPQPVRGLYEGARHHDADDTLRELGIPVPPDYDDQH